jgi:hypothetical protein
LQCVYRLTPGDLELYFTRWEAKWKADGNKDINNPKIPIKFVRKVGKLVYGTDKTVMEIASKKTAARQRLKSK